MSKRITPLTELLEELRFEAGHYDEAVARAVAAVIEQPLPEKEKRELLTTVFDRLKSSRVAQEDPAACAALADDVRTLVDCAIEKRGADGKNNGRKPVPIQPVNEFPRPVVPKPRFHGMQVDLV